MSNPDDQENRKSFSFQIQPKSRAVNEFHFTGKDNFFSFEGGADLVIERAPLFLVDHLNANEDILTCHNIRFNKDQFYSRVFERHFVRLVSTALQELYKFNIHYQLQGALILLSGEEVEPLTALQKHWLKDFLDLFTFTERSSKGIYQLYLPTNLESFQYYCTLHTLLEKSIISTPLPKI